MVPNKPIYTGFTVLELNKYLMYNFHYKVTKKEFKAELLFTDTDSLTYEINQKMFMKNFLNINICLILGNIKSTFFDPTNKKIIGKMKDEFKRTSINRFIGLKSKMYSIVSKNGEKVNTEKGVNISTEFEEYANVLFNKKVIRHKMNRIQSELHKLSTCDVCKISLSCFDGKRYILNDGITALAYFIKIKRFKFC